MKRRTLFILLLCAVALSIGKAEPAQAQALQAGVDFTTLIPRGDFRDNISNNGYGAGGYLAVRVKSSPILLGFDGGYVTYGSESRREPLSSTIPNVRVRVDTTNNILLTHLLLRAQPQRGKVRPYADGLVGLKYLYTTTSISDEFDGEELASTKDFSDTTFSYGFGGGVMFQLTKLDRPGIWLDGRVRYLRGGHAEYLKKGSIREVNGRVQYDVLSSRTDVITAQIGITFTF